MVQIMVHYLNQFWNIVNWTFKNKLQWNFDQNSYIFIQENAFEYVVCIGLNVLISENYSFMMILIIRNGFILEKRLGLHSI